MKLTLDPAALTFGDLEDFETLTGTPLMDTFANVNDTGIHSLRAKDLVGLVWICARSENAEFTLDDARKVRLDDLEFEVGAAPDPTSDSGTPSS